MTLRPELIWQPTRPGPGPHGLSGRSGFSSTRPRPRRRPRGDNTLRLASAPSRQSRPHVRSTHKESPRSARSLAKTVRMGGTPVTTTPSGPTSLVTLPILARRASGRPSRWPGRTSPPSRASGNGNSVPTTCSAVAGRQSKRPPPPSAAPDQPRVVERLSQHLEAGASRVRRVSSTREGAGGSRRCVLRRREPSRQASGRRKSVWGGLLRRQPTTPSTSQEEGWARRRRDRVEAEAVLEARDQTR